MKDLRNLKGAKLLSKTEQQAISGGRIACGRYGGVCPPGMCCMNNTYCGVPNEGDDLCYPEI